MGKMLDADLLCKGLQAEVRELCEQVAAGANKVGGLRELDAMVRKLVLSLGDRVMAQAVAQVAEVPTAPVPCPQCARAMVFKQWRSMTIRCVTTGQAIDVRSPYMTCAECQVGRLVLRDQLGVDRDGLTLTLRHAGTLAGTLEPYEPAAETVLAELAGIELSGTKIHSICQDGGAVAQALMSEGILGDSRQLLPDERLYVEADGLMLWIDDGWHEVKLAVLFASSERADISKDRKQVTHRQYVVVQGTPDELGKLLWQAAQRWLPKDCDGAPIVRNKVVFLADGAVWLAKMAEAWLPGARIVLDFFHVAEHIATAGRVVHPSDELARKRWTTRQRDLLLQGDVTEMLGGLLVEAKRKGQQASVRDELVHLHSYLNDRKAGLCYLLQTSQGLDIGSGPAESAANHVLQQRMKRAGMRWDRPGGAAMAALRCAYRSTGGMAAIQKKIQLRMVA
jgi:hypothetical protein